MPGKMYKNSFRLSLAFSEGYGSSGANPHHTGTPEALAWTAGNTNGLTDYAGVAQRPVIVAPPAPPSGGEGEG